MKKKKNVILLVGLVLILAGAICALVLVPDNKEKSTKGTDNDKEQEAQASTDLVQESKDQVTGIEFSMGDNTVYSLTKGDSWSIEKAEYRIDKTKTGYGKEALKDAVVDDEIMEKTVNEVDNILATKKLQLEADVKPEDYGLGADACKLTLNFGEKTETLLMGTEAGGDNTGYYVKVEGDDSNVYIISNVVYETYFADVEKFIKKDEISDINSDYMTGISIKDSKKKESASFVTEFVSDKDRLDLYTNWVIKEPFKYDLAGCSTEDWNNMMRNYTSLTFDDMAEYKCEDLDKYGLKNPRAVVTIDYFELSSDYVEEAKATPEPADDNKSAVTKQITGKANVIPKKYQIAKKYICNIGSQNENGDYFVTVYTGSNDTKKPNVYTMSSDNVMKMIDINPYDYADHCVYATLATDIEGYEVKAKDVDVKVTRKSIKGDDDKEKNEWTINGKKVEEADEEAFLKPYSKAYLLEYSSNAKDSVKPKSDKPVLTMTFHEKDRDVTVKYLPYDGVNFYRVDKDGMDLFVVDKRSVDDVIAAFKDLQK